MTVPCRCRGRGERRDGGLGRRASWRCWRWRLVRRCAVERWRRRRGRHRGADRLNPARPRRSRHLRDMPPSWGKHSTLPLQHRVLSSKGGDGIPAAVHGAAWTTRQTSTERSAGRKATYVSWETCCFKKEESAPVWEAPAWP